MSLSVFWQLWATDFSQFCLHAITLQCLELVPAISRGVGMTQVQVTRRFNLSLLFSQTCYIDPSHHQTMHQPQPGLTPNLPSQESQGRSDFGDSSEPLFSMYSKITEEEDNKMTERWQKDADGILIFVSPCIAIHTPLCINWNTVDRFILCSSRRAARGVGPRPQTKLPGHLGVLPRENIRAALFERNTCVHSFHHP